MPNPTALLPLYYLPHVQYMSKWLAFGEVRIEQHEHYSKGAYRNRCHIAGANGPLLLSVPLLKGKNEQQPIREVRIAYQQPWQTQHWQSIQSAYGKSPYFLYYADAFEALYQQKPALLFDWNVALLTLLLRCLKLPAELAFTQRYEGAPAAGVVDFREQLSAKMPAEADVYFKSIVYPQVFAEKHGFLPNLSTLDLLFCTGPEASLYLQRSAVSAPV